MQDMSTRHPSSYRDPSGFLFYHDGNLYRQVNTFFQEDYDRFISGGLYDHLTSAGMLISHHNIEQNLTGSPDWYKTIEPEKIPFISFPYEWCFGMWKDAALATLQIAKEAMKFGMMLKDASAYNLQLHHGRMLFIDTLSFEQYDEEKYWIAYRQFCEHFLAPLALMHYLKEPLQNLFVAYPDGIPLHVGKKLLPFRSRLNLHTYLHLHVHANVTKKSGRAGDDKNFSSRKKLTNILDSLHSAISVFSLQSQTGVWSGYYAEASQRNDYLSQKKLIIDNWIRQVGPSTALDAGANEGEFSELLTSKGVYTISADFDHYSVNNLYAKIKKDGRKNQHPVIIDLSNPSPALGVNNAERASFTDRVNVDLVMALALIHHLAIGKNIPFDDIARMFKKLCKHLIIEFVPKEDEKVQLMLQQKKDIYHGYTKELFLDAFSQRFRIAAETLVPGTHRTLYLMEAYEF